MSRPFPLPEVRRVAAAGLAAAMIFTGCQGSATPRPNTIDIRQSPPPSGARVATIVSVNSEHGFVVVEFASPTLPTVGTRVNIYRNGKPVGAVRITEPARAPLATADIVEGEVHVGDEAR